MSRASLVPCQQCELICSSIETYQYTGTQATMGFLPHWQMGRNINELRSLLVKVLGSQLHDTPELRATRIGSNDAGRNTLQP